MRLGRNHACIKHTHARQPACSYFGTGHAHCEKRFWVPLVERFWQNCLAIVLTELFWRFCQTVATVQSEPLQSLPLISYKCHRSRSQTQFNRKETHLEFKVFLFLLQRISLFQNIICVWNQIVLLIRSNSVPPISERYGLILVRLYGLLHCVCKYREGVLYLARSTSIIP